MATKTINTRIGLKYDSYSAWEAVKDTFIPIKGEVIFYEIPAAAGAVVNEPAILFKVGDGVKTLAQLPWGSAISADVYSWAKQQTLLGGKEDQTTHVWDFTNPTAVQAATQAEVAAFVHKETATLKMKVDQVTEQNFASIYGIPYDSTNPDHVAKLGLYQISVSTDNGSTWTPSGDPFAIQITQYSAGDGITLDQSNAFSVKPKTGGYISVDSEGVAVTPSAVTYTPGHNTQYAFTSYGSESGGEPYGQGTAELVSQADGKTTVKVISNPADTTWEGRTLTVNATSPTEGQRYELYEGTTGTGVWVSIDRTTEAVQPTITATEGVLTDGAVSSIKSYVDEKASAQSTAGAVTVEKLAAATEGFASTYVVKQGGVQVGAAIDIPKDFLVKSAELKTVETAGVPYAEAQVGDKYIDLTVNTPTDTETGTHIYLPVKDLVDVYKGNWTSGTDAAGDTGFVKIEVNSSNVVSAHTYTLSLSEVHNETYAFTSYGDSGKTTVYGTGVAEKISSDSTANTTTVKVTQNSVPGWTGRVFTVDSTTVTTGQLYQLKENGTFIPVWVEIGTVTPATADALATVNDVKSYVDTHIAQATPNIEGQEAIGVTASGNSKVVSLKLNDDAQNDQYSGLKQGNNGLEINDDLTWYLQCGSSTVNID